MGIEVREFDGDDGAEWDEHVESSPQATIFHRYGWLAALERHSEATLYRLIGYKGQEPVGIFPVFELSMGPVSAAFSPPPKVNVPHLGPALLNYRKLKQRKFEKRHTRFIEGCLDWIDREIDPSYSHIQTGIGYDDPRPFDWNEFDVMPRYTYALDLTDDPDEVLARFMKSPRRSITNEGADCRVQRVGEDGIEFIVDQVEARYDAHGSSFDIDPAFVRDLARALPDEEFRVYVGTVEGDRASGIIAPAHDGTVYFWLGGVKPETDVPINDHIHWKIITDAIENGETTYDFVGANTPRICRYKAKFNPRLASYYELERDTPLTRLASTVYRRLQ